MDQNSAWGLWWAATRTVVGCDHDGNDSEQMTVFGGATIGAGCPIGGKDVRSPEGRARIAAFLHGWADELGGTAVHTFPQWAIWRKS